MKGTFPNTTSPARYGPTNGSYPYCCRTERACSPRSREATRAATRLGSPNHGLQGITKPGCFVGGELNNSPAAAFKRDTHDDAAPLLGDLKRTVTRPRLHRRHPPSPSGRTHRVV